MPKKNTPRNVTDDNEPFAQAKLIQSSPRGQRDESWYWGEFSRTLDRGVHPNFEMLANALRSPDIPSVPMVVREYLADIITGERKRPRGRQKNHPFEKASQEYWISYHVKGLRDGSVDCRALKDCPPHSPQKLLADWPERTCREENDTDGQARRILVYEQHLTHTKEVADLIVAKLLGVSLEVVRRDYRLYEQQLKAKVSPRPISKKS
jgi:hypothetical protein